MTAIPSASAGLVVVGANHKSSTQAVRERLTLDGAALARFLERLKADGVPDALVLSTSERVEVYAVHDRPARAARAVTHALSQHAGLGADELRGQIYVFEGEEAVRHLFAVAAALDSLMVGEPQVLAQLAAGRDLAREHGTLGPALETVVEAALETAERVRAETGLGRRPVSIAAAAAGLARDIHGDLGGCTGLVLGPGDMGELLAERLAADGLGRLILTGRSATRLEQAGRRLKCPVVPIDTLAETLAEADIVIAAAGTGPHLITAPMVEAALKRRRRRPVFLIDAAIPGDIDPSVADLDGAFLYDLGDLERVVLEGGAERAAAAEAAWERIEAEVGAYVSGAGAAEADSGLEALRRHLEAVRADVLAGPDGADAAAATRALVERLLQGPAHGPGRGEAGRKPATGGSAMDALRRLLGVGGRPRNGGGT